MKKKTKAAPSSKVGNAALEPLVKYCAETPGSIQEIADDLTALTGEVQYRQNVRKWLHPDPRLRREPRLGIGLMLLTIAHVRNVEAACVPIDGQAGMWMVRKRR